MTALKKYASLACAFLFVIVLLQTSATAQSTQYASSYDYKGELPYLRYFSNEMQVSPQQPGPQSFNRTNTPHDEYSSNTPLQYLITSKELQKGEYYFSGKEPDSVGHGIGLSQWGAYGAAQKGWDYSEILTFYYTSTAIQKIADKTISVSGHGTMSVEDYVSSLGEIPSKACGTQEDISAWKAYADSQNWPANDPRRSKYIIDNTSTVWDCWPEETIKAQIVAARTYGISYVTRNHKPICTTPACQVYSADPDKPKAWAAHETKDEYIVSTGSTHEGNIIEAYYSANNHNGIGTADNDTVWTPITGYGTYYSYLRSVADDRINYDYGITRKEWTTNSYSIEELHAMLTWCVTNCASGATVKREVVDVIKDLQSISLIKDPSERVKRVIFTGSNGKQAALSGVYFKAMFNFWSSSVKSNGKVDSMPGITFDFKAVPEPKANRFGGVQKRKQITPAPKKDKIILLEKEEKNKDQSKAKRNHPKDDFRAHKRLQTPTPSSEPVSEENQQESTYTVTEQDTEKYRNEDTSTHNTAPSIENETRTDTPVHKEQKQKVRVSSSVCEKPVNENPQITQKLPKDTKVHMFYSYINQAFLFTSSDAEKEEIEESFSEIEWIYEGEY
ncbi:MAG: SpoIID/LytB domain-containing protein [Candidatus Dojkabacteria bacterium]